MITFNGTNIETAVSGIMIEDIRVNPIQLAPVARPRAILAGSDFVRVRDETRTIIVTFAIPTMDRDSRRAALDALTEWACVGEVGALGLPNRDGRLIDAVCTVLPQPSMRQWWENKLSLTFTAYDPYFYSSTEKSANCGTAFTVGGTAPPLMRIERTLSSSAINQSYSDGTNTMTFSTIPAGNMVIDLNRQTATVGTTSLMVYFSNLSKFILPRVGTLTITGTGTVKYTERWR